MRPESLQQCGSPPPVYTDCRRHGLELLCHDSRNSTRGQRRSFFSGSFHSTSQRLALSRAIQSYPDFGSIVDTIDRHVAKERSSIGPGQNAMVYILKEGLLPEGSFWIRYVRVERMRTRSTVLYRPEIVHDLVQRIAELLASNRRTPLMVKGPRGVGKSYSLINFTRHLMAI